MPRQCCGRIKLHVVDTVNTAARLLLRGAVRLLQHKRHDAAVIDMKHIVKLLVILIISLFGNSTVKCFDYSSKGSGKIRHRTADRNTRSGESSEVFPMNRPDNTAAGLLTHAGNLITMPLAQGQCCVHGFAIGLVYFGPKTFGICVVCFTVNCQGVIIKSAVL